MLLCSRTPFLYYKYYFPSITFILIMMSYCKLPIEISKDDRICPTQLQQWLCEVFYTLIHHLNPIIYNYEWGDMAIFSCGILV